VKYRIGDGNHDQSQEGSDNDSEQKPIESWACFRHSQHMLGMVRLKNGRRRLVCDRLHIGYITVITVCRGGMYSNGTYQDSDFVHRVPTYDLRRKRPISYMATVSLK
jgi:hypothetical protein